MYNKKKQTSKSLQYIYELLYSDAVSNQFFFNKLTLTYITLIGTKVTTHINIHFKKHHFITKLQP